MAGVGIRVFYDSDGDIFEVVEDPQKPYISKEIRHGVFVHVEPKSGRIVGFAVHHLSQDHGELVPIKPNFQLMADSKQERELVK